MPSPPGIMQHFRRRLALVALAAALWTCPVPRQSVVAADPPSTVESDAGGLGATSAADSDLPVADSKPQQGRPRRVFVDDELTPAQKRTILTMEVISAAWFFVLGAAVGSFLNVVVYRMPSGIPLSHPKSRCPACLTPISRRDNIPIVSWLRLRGRCRTCGVRISPRYALVEAATGGLFLSFAWLELLSGGETLPVREPNHYAGVLWILWYTKWDLVGLYLYHMFLVVALLSMALIARDGHSQPRRLLAITGTVGFVAPVVWPGLHPVPFRIPYPAWLPSWRWSVEWSTMFSGGWRQRFGVGLDGAIDGLCGASAGALLGALLAYGIPAGDGRNRRADLVALSATVGVFVGWQAAFSVTLLATLLRLAESTAARLRRSNPAVITPIEVLFAATVSHLLLWRPLSELTWWPGPFSRPLVFVGCASLIAGAAWRGKMSVTKPPEPAVIEPMQGSGMESAPAEVSSLPTDQ